MVGPGRAFRVRKNLRGGKPESRPRLGPIVHFFGGTGFGCFFNSWAAGISLPSLSM